MGTAGRTNIVKKAKVREYANITDVCVKLDIFYLILNVMKVSIQEIHTNKSKSGTFNF